MTWAATHFLGGYLKEINMHECCSFEAPYIGHMGITATELMQLQLRFHSKDPKITLFNLTLHSVFCTNEYSLTLECQVLETERETDGLALLSDEYGCFSGQVTRTSITPPR